MSDVPPPPPAVSPPPERRPLPPYRPSRVPAVLFGMSLTINLLVLGAVILACGLGYSLMGRSKDESAALTERYQSGKKSATDKIAIVTIDGILLEGMNSYAEKQIDQAAQDKNVKAVVVRINSPGGSITSSDDLHRRLSRLRDGDSTKGTSPKKLVVSMDSIAASGGYYIAMPASHIYAERSTLTGSIGVYASFIDLSGLSKLDPPLINMTYIKRGAVKASGNPFYKMTDEEYAMWDDMVGHAYGQFLTVVKESRGDRLKTQDLATKDVIDETKSIPFNERDKDQHMVTKMKEVRYKRQLADGGIWTADKAKEFGLIDDIGYLEDAVKKAHDLAGMGDDWKAVTYQRPSLLKEWLLGAEAEEQKSGIDAAKLANAATPRLWYLAPQSELAGILRAAGH